MCSLNEEGEDVFFDTYDHIRNSVDSSSSEISTAEIQESVLEKFEYEVWTRELVSVRERRNRFLRGIGLDELMPSRFSVSRDCDGGTSDRGEAEMEPDRITERSGAVFDSCPSSPYNDGTRESECCIKDLDSGRIFVVQDLQKDGSFSLLKEVGSDRLITLPEFKALLGISYSAQRFIRRVGTPSRDEHNRNLNGGKKKNKSWWRSLPTKGHMMGICKSDVSVLSPKLPRTISARTQQHCKRCLEFTELCTGQEIHAHKGSIRAMRFDPFGWYLATGGEDCIVRIWQVGEVEASCECFITNNSSRCIDNTKDKKLRLGGKGTNPNPLVIPEKIFKIRETPVQEFRGHTSDILDLSWSNADCLLTSSKDKTVRMWKVGCNGCLKVFQHNDYVTCIQFNPVDEKYFISGSIDGKVRIWSVSENRVVDWADVRDIVTAICYRPDGKGFVVGSIAGTCRFYDYSENTMQLGAQFCVQSKKKSDGKRITGLQFSPKDSERIMVSSADSKVRIFDGVEVIHKFRGLRKTKSHLSASFTSDGRYIVSVGEDSHVYIWNYNISGSSSSKSIPPCEQFFSEGVNVALPWPGTDHMVVGLSDGNLRLPFPLNMLERSTWLKDSESCYLGALLLIDGLTKVSATWPAEKLPRLSLPPFQVDKQDYHSQQDGGSPQVRYPSSMQNLVIVTANSTESIRSFQNYGLPFRLEEDRQCLPK